MSANVDKIDLAGGCFWNIEEHFRVFPGVLSTQVGYEGGNTDSPTYEQVCAHTTGHAETVQIVFDPKQASLEKLLDKFFDVHDPTQLNRQGPDVGDNYRSAVFYYTDEQRDVVQKKIAELSKSREFKQPIVTEVTKATTFWPAEEYHQQYVYKQNNR